MDKAEVWTRIRRLAERELKGGSSGYIEALGILEQYAQQVSREVGQKQCDTCITDGSLCPGESIVPCPYWKSNQEDK